MPLWAIALITILAIAVITETGWILMRKRRSEHLRDRFGPEYDRVIQEHGSQRRVERLHIRPLTQKDRDHFAHAWQADQARFVDDPKAAVTEADLLVTEVMKA